MKEVIWQGDSLAVLRTFPEEVREAAGYQLDNLQNDLPVANAFPALQVGSGVSEILISEDRQYSIFYTIQYYSQQQHKLYVLHACVEKVADDIKMARQQFALLETPPFDHDSAA